MMALSRQGLDFTQACSEVESYGSPVPVVDLGADSKAGVVA